MMDHMRIMSRFLIYISILFGADAIFTLAGQWYMQASMASPYNFLINAALAAGIVLLDIHRGNLE